MGLKKHKGLLLAAAVLLGGVWWFFQPPEVRVAEVEVGSAAQFVYASGQVIPREKTAIRSKNNARIAQVLVEEGQQVRAGAVLVRLENEEPAALYAAAMREVEQARGDHIFYQRELERYQQLFRQGVVAQREYDSAINQATRAQEALRRAEASLQAQGARHEDMLLRSPYDGVVVERVLDPGAAVGVNDSILQVAKAGRLEIEGKVDELDAARVQVGQRVYISFDSRKGTVFQGTIRVVAPRVDSATKSLKVKIDLDGEPPVTVGMSAELNILQGEKQAALLIPAGALAGNQVWVVEDGRAKVRTVRIGIRDAQRVEIVEGLRRGEKVILQPQELKDQQRVRPTAA